MNLLENQREWKAGPALIEVITGWTFEEYWGSAHPGRGGVYGRYTIMKPNRVTVHSLYPLSGLPSASRQAAPERMIMPSIKPHRPPNPKVISVTII